MGGLRRGLAGHRRGAAADRRCATAAAARASRSAWSARRVTFDTGGISIKPSAGMQEMKMDMSGGAAVLEAVAAIAELGLPIDLLAVVPVDREHAVRAPRSSPATSSPSSTARRSRSTTPTPRAA